jgi:hypothetical protein
VKVSQARRRRAAILALGVSASILVITCGPVESAMTVHNRTTVPITFSRSGGLPQLVPACESIRFVWMRGWERASPAPEATLIPADAREVVIYVAPPADAAMAPVDVVVTADRVIEHATGPLPDCAGVPPTASPVPGTASPSP